MPIKNWLLKKDFKTFVLKTIDDNNPFLKNLVKIKKLKKDIENNNSKINSMFVWQVTNFCLWYNTKKKNA